MNSEYKLRKAVSAFVLCALFVACIQVVDAQERIKIAVWGDSRENLDNACEDIASILLTDITDWDIQVHTGDFTHKGSETDWQRTLRYKGVDKLFVRDRILLCTSNHDAGSSDSRKSWDKHTAGVLPVNTMDSTTHFYAWKKGNVHVVCCDGFFTDANVMQQWLDEYLKNIPEEDWLIGVWHNPSYSDISYKEGYGATSIPWLKSLARRGGDFVLNGHAHLYVRTKPLLPDGTINGAQGMVHIINGTGGATWKDPALPNPKIAFTPSIKSFPCITFITFEGHSATVQTVDARPGSKLRVIDEWKWTK